ncbi:PIN domain-containing protein [Butyrivibrio sp. AC2005]|uniref:PIN domain-containing protein n=1 Tax=Butyrivibrio sp. AC2005 TaxID=1280672 RepID=UPI0004130CDB|nr:PIN domain-containing protein [Butyrivibrio sp. AC2005]
MKVLVDTNIMIDYMKRPTEKMIEVFQNEDIVISGVVISELFHGALSEKELDSLEEDLSVYESLNITESDWNEFGRFLYTLRKSGLTVPYPDAIISYVAIKNDVPVWTKDKHFKLIQAAEDKLKLYDYSE